MVFNFVDSIDTFHAINVSNAAMYLVKKDNRFDIYKGTNIVYPNVYINADSTFENIFTSANVYIKGDSKVDVVRSEQFFKDIILGNAYFNINLKVSMREVSALSINDFELFALYMRNYNDTGSGSSGGDIGSGGTVDIDSFADSNTINRNITDNGAIIFEINDDTMNLINSVVNRVSNVEFKNHLEDYSNPHRVKMSNLIDTNITDVKNNQVISYDASKSKFVNRDLPVDELAGKVKLDADSEGKYLNEFADNSTIVVNNGKLCAKKIVGQTVTVAELNTLAGMDTPIKPILESIASGRGFTGTIGSKAELDAITDMRNGDIKIVTNDETNGNSKFTYIYYAPAKEWQPIGVADVNFRDFSVNKLDLETEATGVLSQSNMDLTDLVFVKDLENFMKKTTYDADGDGIVDFAKTLYGLVSTVKEIDTAVENSHNHPNEEFLASLSPETIGSGVKLSDFADSSSIVVTKNDDKITIALTDKLLAKINNVDNKTDNKDFLLHLEDDSNPHGVNIKSLTDIDFTNMIDQTVLVYDAATDKFKFKMVAGSSDGKIKLTEDSDLKYLSDIIDNNTIVSENNQIVAKKLKGQEVTIEEINYLVGLDKPVKDLFDSVSSLQKFTGVVDTKADLDLVTGMKNGDMKIVLTDETNGGQSYKYAYSEEDSAWVGIGPNDVTIRDFSVDKLDLSTEVKGVLSQDNMNLTGIVKTSDLSGYMKRSDYDVNGNITVDAAETLIGLEKTATQINDAVEKAHKHSDTTIAILDGLSDTDGLLSYNGIPVASGAKFANSKNAGVVKANSISVFDTTEVKIDPNTGFLYSEGDIKEVVPDLTICTATATYPNASNPAINIFKDTGKWGTHIDIGSKQPVMDIDFGESLKFNAMTFLGTDRSSSINDIDVYIYDSETATYILDIAIKNAATHANNLVAYCLTKVYDTQKIRLIFKALKSGANRYELARVRLYLDKGFGTNPGMDYKNISMYESINDYEKLIHTPKIDDIDLTSASTKKDLGIASLTELSATTELATHNNRNVIDKFSEDADGNPLYNGNLIKGEETTISAEDGNAIEQKDDGIYVEDLSSQIQNLKVRTRAGEKLTYCQLGLSAVQDSLAAGNIVKFDTVLSTNGIENNTANYSVKLLAGRTYRLTPVIGVGSPAGYVRYVIYNLTTSTIISKKYYYAFSSTDVWTNNNTMPTIYECTQDCEVVIKIDFVSGSTQIQNVASMFIVEETARQYYEDPARKLNDSYGIEDAPVGHIISYMGITAPKHYLICDGSIYNIVDYPELAEHILTQFGSYNYWGGDGTTTFAVPDMRGEFVRGVDSTALKDPNGVTRGVGKHQDGTSIPVAKLLNSSYGIQMNTPTTTIYSTTGTADKTVAGTTYLNIKADQSGAQVSESTMVARPTNVNTLFCIKYEATYFMYSDKLIYGGFFKDVIFNGKANEVGTTYTILNPITDYKQLIIETRVRNSENVEILIPLSEVAIELNTTQYLGFSYFTNSGSLNSSANMTIKFTSETELYIDAKSYNVWKDIYIAKIYGIKTEDDLVTDEEIAEVVEEITGGDKSWLD